MRTEEASCTVLHRLIREQLRYGNPTDTRTLLAIQQQALRSAGGPHPSAGAPSQEERQEPQGQEHHSDFQHSEFYQLRRHEPLPTYEQAKADAHFSAPGWCQEGARERHGRALSEQLVQREDHAGLPRVRSSCSYPRLAGCRGEQHTQHDHQGSYQDVENHHSRPPPLFYSQHDRIVQQTPEALRVYCSLPPAGVEASTHTELLAKENERLRQELEDQVEKTSRIQKLEQEIQRISEAYQTLMQGCVKREALERTFRSKLTSEVTRLQEINGGLRESLELRSKQEAKEQEVKEQEVKEQEANRHVITELLLQKEEQRQNCARLEREVQLLREESSSAQTRSRQLQAELRRKSAYVERVERLQGALAQLQATCEKRESLELRLRTRLEQELRILRTQQRQPQSPPAGSSSSSSWSLLQERLREREEQVLALEADMMRWQQKYLEEKTMRDFAMDAAATAATQRDTTIINHSPGQSSKNSFSEDLPQPGVLTQEVENRIRSLYRQVMEKDAVITVLQQRHHQEQDKGEAGEGVSSLNPSPSDTGPSRDEDLLMKLPDPFEGLDDVKPEALEIFI